MAPTIVREISRKSLYEAVTVKVTKSVADLVHWCLLCSSAVARWLMFPVGDASSTSESVWIPRRSPGVGRACVRSNTIGHDHFFAISTRGCAMLAGVGPVFRASTKAWLSVLVFRVVCVVSV